MIEFLYPRTKDRPAVTPNQTENKETPSGIWVGKAIFCSFRSEVLKWKCHFCSIAEWIHQGGEGGWAGAELCPGFPGFLLYGRSFSPLQLPVPVPSPSLTSQTSPFSLPFWSKCAERWQNPLLFSCDIKQEFVLSPQWFFSICGRFWEEWAEVIC